MITKNTLSVALCTFNGEKYLEKQILSILNQELEVNEIVVCDDGSTDQTLSILDNICKMYPNRIKVFENTQNLGSIKNFENAILKCLGEIIFLADQDDIWNKNKTKSIISYLESNKNKKVVFTNASLIDDNDLIIENKSLFEVVNFVDRYQKMFDRGFAIELQNIGNRITGATMAFYREYIIGILPFKIIPNILHDEFIALHAINNNCLGFINEKLIRYRIHSQQHMGLNIWLKNPPDSNVYKLHVLRNEYHFVLNFNPVLLNRVNFILFRTKNYKSSIGIIKTILSMNKYINEYRVDWFFVFIYDIKEFFALNLRRIFRLFTINKLKE